MGSSASVESIRKQIEERTPRRAKIPTSVDLPLSHESKRILVYAAEEAERLNHHHIGAEHLLLGILREERSFVAELLQRRGLSLEQIREAIALSRGGRIGENSRFELLLGACLGAQEKETGIAVVIEPQVLANTPSIGVCVGDSESIGGHSIPFLCIEILSSRHPFSEMERRSKEYLKVGVRYVWLLDPVWRLAFIATPELGLCEFKDQVLTTESPKIELPLNEIFD